MDVHLLTDKMALLETSPKHMSPYHTELTSIPTWSKVLDLALTKLTQPCQLIDLCWQLAGDQPCKHNASNPSILTRDAKGVAIVSGRNCRISIRDKRAAHAWRRAGLTVGVHLVARRADVDSCPGGVQGVRGVHWTSNHSRPEGKEPCR